MYKQSDAALTAWRATERTLDGKVTITDSSGNETDYATSDITSIAYDSGAWTGDTFSIGSTYENNITVTFAHLVEGLKQGYKVAAKIGIKLPDGTYEYCPLGVFIISDEITMDRNNDATTIKAYDQFCVMQGTYTSKLTYPAKVTDVIAEIANMSGVTLNTNDIAELPTQTDLASAISGQTYCTAIGWIAQFYGGFALFDRDGKLTIRTVTDASYILDASQYEQSGLTKNEATYQIGGMSVSVTTTTTDSTGESSETTSTLTAGETTGSQIELTNNVMTQARLDSIWSTIKDITFYPYSLTWFGNPAIEAGDWLTLKDTAGNSFNVPNNSYTMTFDGGLTATSKADQTSTSSSSYSYSGTLSQTVKQLAGRQGATGNYIFGTDVVVEPTTAKIGDQWYKQNGNKVEIWQYQKQSNGTGKWVIVVSDATAEDVKTAVAAAQSDATEALTNAANAATVADNAKTVGDNAATVANTAKTAAAQAQTDASTAVTKANTAASDASSALAKAQTSIDTANTASDTATAVQEQVTTLKGGSAITLAELENGLATKISSDEFTSYKTQTDNALINKVSSTDFASYQTQTDSAIQQRITTTDAQSLITTTANVWSANLSTLQDQVTNGGSPNLILNSNFATGNTEHWDLGKYGVLDNSVTYQGTPSLKLSVSGLTSDGWNFFSTDRRIPVSEGDVISFGAYMKTQDVSNNWYLELQTYSDKTSSRKSFSGGAGLSGTHDWVLCSGVYVIPSGINYVDLHVYMQRNGTGWMSRPMLVKASTLPAYSPSPEDNATTVALAAVNTALTSAINLRVQKNDVINQINISTESILIGGSKVHITGSTTIDNAVITSAMVASLSADKLTAGTIDASKITVKNINASNITSGSIAASLIASTQLDASNITTGTLDASKITVENVSASSITSGTLNASLVNVTNLNANNITSGTLSGTNLSLNLSTGEVLFQKGSIKSVDGHLNIAIDDGSFTIADYFGSGFAAKDGELKFYNGLFKGTTTEIGGLNISTLNGGGMNVYGKSGLDLGTNDSATTADAHIALISNSYKNLLGEYVASIYSNADNFNFEGITGSTNKSTFRVGTDSIWLNSGGKTIISASDVNGDGVWDLSASNTGGPTKLSGGTPDTTVNYIWIGAQQWPGCSTGSAGKPGDNITIAAGGIWLNSGGEVIVNAPNNFEVRSGGFIAANGYGSHTQNHRIDNECWINGNFSVSGTKNAVVETSTGYVNINAYETAEYFFGDLGFVNTGSGSKVKITFDSLFLETINTAVGYHVFISSYGNGYAWCSEKGADYFIIESSVPNLDISYEVKAKRKGYENDRLEVNTQIEEMRKEAA